MIIHGIEFNTDWEEGKGEPKPLPVCAGIYCEVYWPVKGTRIGITNNFRRRHGQHRGWMRGLHSGKDQSRSQGALANYAREYGDVVELFVLSRDPSLADETMRKTCEAELHVWAKEQMKWLNFNYENTTRNLF